MIFEDKPLSNSDLKNWCNQLKIPLVGIYARNEPKPKNHSPCIINLDDLGSAGTHWVCCRHSEGVYEYFDSFGLPPPQEWEDDLERDGHHTFLRNFKQIQDNNSVLCGYYCLLFLHQRHLGTSYKEIVSGFSNNFCVNETIVKNYFKTQEGGAFDVHNLLGKLPKPKKGWTLPGHNYTGPYNPLDKQLRYNPETGEILEIYQQPTGPTDAIAMQHDVDYSVCSYRGGDVTKCKNAADAKMVEALDAVPFNERQWGHALARNVIAGKEKLGLGAARG